MWIENPPLKSGMSNEYSKILRKFSTYAEESLERVQLCITCILECTRNTREYKNGSTFEENERRMIFHQKRNNFFFYENLSIPILFFKIKFHRYLRKIKLDTLLTRIEKYRFLTKIDKN